MPKAYKKPRTPWYVFLIGVLFGAFFPPFFYYLLQTGGSSPVWLVPTILVLTPLVLLIVVTWASRPDPINRPVRQAQRIKLWPSDPRKSLETAISVTFIIMISVVILLEIWFPGKHILDNFFYWGELIIGGIALILTAIYRLPLSRRDNLS